VVALDIDRASRPSVVASLETGLPFRSGTADVVLMFNVLEHVFHHQELMGEVHRVLKPGGRAHVYVPFMHKVHAHPYDFFRYTGESLRRIGERAGFRSVEVEPYGGLFVALYENLKVFVRTGPLRWLFAAALLAADGVFGRLRRDINSTYVIGYYALLTK
jgi:SAM-dependent methyltransferase